jgi:hypothetical protein
MIKGRRRVLLIAVIAVVVIAAVVTAVLLLHRGKSGGVHYLTSVAATATIAETVKADFTLASARDAMTISLSGTGSASSSSTGTPATTARIILKAAPADSSPSPSPSETTPTLTSFSPASGPVGATVTLTGTGLGGVTAVGFDGRPAKVFKALSDTQVTVTVPPGALSGLIVVTTPAGTAVSATPFTVTGKRSPQPTPSPSATRSGGGSGGSGGGSGGTSASRTGSTASGTGYTASGSSSSSASASSSASSGTSTSVGVVTGIALPAGATPRTLQRLLTVSGRPIYAFVSVAPLYTTLSSSLASGAQRSNVAALQHALKKAGYFSGTVNGVFGASTTTALEDWQAAHGLTRTGTITTSRFVWVPKGALLESWNVVLGGSVSTTTALATVEFPRELIAQALVTQADVASLKVGQKAALTIDGSTGASFTATITSIASQAASSSSGSTSSTVEYTVDLAPAALPALARSGMTGSLTVTIASRANALVVPTSAVTAGSSSSFVRVMMNGVPAYRQVTTGMTTSSLTQITSGLAAGETVVTGQYTNASAANASSSGGLGGFGGFPGGGSFRRSSGGASTTSGGGQ